MQDGAAEQQATHEQAAGLSEAADPELKLVAIQLVKKGLMQSGLG
jgi:hypothetical protein